MVCQLRVKVDSANQSFLVDVFVEGLTSIGNDPELIADSIYGSTQLMNGNDFAAEFLRRRNQAEKGIVEASVGYGSSSAAGDKSGGWSEVAKKGPPKEEPTAGFKVVPNKKKGKK